MCISNRKLLAAAACAALVLASCGKTDSSKAADVENTTQPPATVSQAAQEMNTDAAAVTETTAVTETEAAPGSETAPESEIPPEPEPEASTRTDLLKTVDPESLFTNPMGGQKTFAELLESGYANVTEEGVGYAVMFSDVAAGHAIMDTYYTLDGGLSWTEDEKAMIVYGSSASVSLEDGRLVIVTGSDKIGPSLAVCSVSFDKDAEGAKIVFSERNKLSFNDVPEPASLKPEIEYLGGYDIRLTVSDSISGGSVYEGQAELDRDTLELVLPDAAD